MENMPPSKLPSWLQKKLDREQKLLQKEEESSVDQLPLDSQVSGSPDVLTSPEQSPSGKTGMQAAGEDGVDFGKTQQSGATN